MWVERPAGAWLLLAIALPLARLLVHRLAVAADRRDGSARSAKLLRQADSAVTAVAGHTWPGGPRPCSLLLPAGSAGDGIRSLMGPPRPPHSFPAPPPTLNRLPGSGVMPGSRQAWIRGSEVVPLLEREAQLAALGEYAARGPAAGRPAGAHRRGGGHRQVGAGRAAAARPAGGHAGAGGRATACSPRGRSARSSTSPAQLGGELLELCRAGAPREELFSALLRQVSAAGPAARGGHRGRPLGRRGHRRPAALPRPAPAGRPGRCCWSPTGTRA